MTEKVLIYISNIFHKVRNIIYLIALQKRLPDKIKFSIRSKYQLP